MKKTTLTLVFTVTLFAMASAAFASMAQFSGKWKNTDPNTRGVTTLRIGVSGSRVSIQAWGKCHPKDCDWGKVNATAYAPNASSNLAQSAQALSAVFKTNFSRTLLVIHAVSGNRLQVETLTHFTDNSGRTDYRNVYTFTRTKVTAQQAVREDCVSFNPNTSKVAKIQGNYKIVDGSHWLFDFGNKKSEARQALKIIKHYRMNQSCFVGRPDPSFQYMLSSGRAPAGRFSGEDSVSFIPNTTVVKKINGRWKIVDGSHWIFDFGNKKSEAKQALAIIKKYGFKNSCFVGRPDPSFEYLRR